VLVTTVIQSVQGNKRGRPNFPFNDDDRVWPDFHGQRMYPNSHLKTYSYSHSFYCCDLILLSDRMIFICWFAEKKDNL